MKVLSYKDKKQLLKLLLNQGIRKISFDKFQ